MATMHENSRALAMALAIVALAVLNAQAIIIAPSSDANDSWVIPGTNVGSAVADGMSTFAPGVGPGGAATGRFGVAIFDLSSIASTPVTVLQLQLGKVDDYVIPLTMEAYWVNTTIPNFPVDLSAFKGTTYDTDITPHEAKFDTLGAATFGTNEPARDTYGNIGSASAADIAVFNAVRQLPDPRILIVYKATAGARDWADTGYHALPPLIIINPPPLGDIDGDLDIDLVDYGIMTDPSHWLKAVNSNTNGDLNGNGFVDLLDFALFKPAYHAFNGGGGASLPAPVPEPSTLALLAATLPAWLLYRRKRAPRCS